MPTNRAHGGTFVQPISLVTPANMGLNKQAESSILGPAWCTAALNAVFDDSGRLAARKGWTNQTSVSASGTPTFEQISEYIRTNATSTIIAAGGDKLWTGLSTWTDITGTATVTEGNNWQFVNFNDAVLGFQHGEQPIIYPGTGTFTDIVASAGTAPQGNCALSAFGRVWAVDDDYQTIKYCALLDELDWSAGSIDMTSVWPHGMDQVTALAAYNGLFVVFGKNSIVIWQDPQGGPLGIDPAEMGVIDTIVGVGCIARDSVQQIDSGDLLFLSASGVQSLSRLIQEKSNPLDNVSKNVRDYLNAGVAAEDLDKIRSVFSPEESFYLLSLPTVGKVFCLETSARLQDGALRVTEWDHLVPFGMARSKAGNLYFSLDTEDEQGKIGTYAGSSDPDGEFTFDYKSAWLDLGEEAAQYLKMAKNLGAVIFISSEASVQVKWAFDFRDNFSSAVKSFAAAGASEWGEMEWGEGEWSGGVSLRSFQVPMSGTGQYIRLGVQANIDGTTLALQSMKLLVKIGRLA